MEVASSTDRRRSRAAANSAAQTAATPRGPSIVEFRGVSKRYPSGDVGLDHATFAVARSEFVFLVGATGSGKSTVMRLLIKEVEPTAALHVRSVQFEPKAQAYAQQARQNPAAYALLGGTNPLPDTFHVTPDNPSNVLAVHAALTPHGVPLDPTIQSVSNKKGYTKRALELTSAVKWGGFAFAILLAIVKVALLDPLFSGWSLVSQIRTIAFPALVAVLLGASALVSAVGSGLSLRRFLRV